MQLRYDNVSEINKYKIQKRNVSLSLLSTKYYDVLNEFVYETT